jgi:chemotaxis methyl-accepting protein methylase
MTIQTKDTYLDKILDLVREKRNLDFSQYRENLLARRVMTRVRLTKRDNFEQYLAYLKFHPQELDNLMDAMTINVTEFFRDAKVFEVIEKEVIPDLINKKPATSDPALSAGRQRPATINIWSCACSSGEEPYSILILIAQHLGTRLADYRLTIHATDIDNEALAKAREGVYEAGQFRNLSPEKKKLINKYFYDMGNKRFWIREEWPGYIDFKYHDTIADPPLENMDIILCRNLFIYFDRDLQNQVLEHFWQSLNRGGFLVMGIVESMLGPIREKFIEYDRECRIYVKK